MVMVWIHDLQIWVRKRESFKEFQKSRIHEYLVAICDQGFLLSLRFHAVKNWGVLWIFCSEQLDHGSAPSGY